MATLCVHRSHVPTQPKGVLGRQTTGHRCVAERDCNDAKNRMVRLEVQFAALHLSDDSRKEAGRYEYDGKHLEHPVDVHLRATREATREQVGRGEGEHGFGHAY